MDAGTDGIRCQTAGPSNLLVSEAGYFSHEKHVAIHFCQRGQRLIDREVDVLRGQSRFHVGQGRWYWLPDMPAVVIEEQVSGDAEQPASHFAFSAGRDSCPADLEKHILRQITREVGLPDGPKEIPEQPLSIGDEQRFGIGHALKDEERSGRPILSNPRTTATSFRPEWLRPPSSSAW